MHTSQNLRRGGRESMKKYKSVIVLVCICAMVAIMLAATNLLTSPIIKENEEAAAIKALHSVMPDGTDFQKIDISEYSLPATVTEAYSESGGGYVIKLTTTGYGSDMVIMCGVNADGTVCGALCLSSSETLGHEKTFGEKFTGKDESSIDGVELISGATLTSTAYRAAVKDALTAANTLRGDRELSNNFTGGTNNEK